VIGGARASLDTTSDLHREGSFSLSNEPACLTQEALYPQIWS